MPVIDTHVHVLDPRRFPYPKRTLGYRPGPSETGTADALIAVMDAHGVDHAVLVQASVYGYDNDAILDALARAPDRFRAVVMAPDDPVALTRLARVPGVCAVRLNLTDFGGHDDHERVVDMARATIDAGLCVQVQAGPERLLGMLDRLGDGPVIIDHLGRPDLGAGTRDLDRIAALAGRAQTWLKVSGGFRLSGGGDWRQTATELKRLTEAFGPDRLLWGSDWPFINTNADRPSYAETLDWGRAAIAEPAASHRAAARLFGWMP